jgi:hypothetical protein
VFESDPPDRCRAERRLRSRNLLSDAVRQIGAGRHRRVRDRLTTNAAPSTRPTSPTATARPRNACDQRREITRTLDECDSAAINWSETTSPRPMRVGRQPRCVVRRQDAEVLDIGIERMGQVIADGR